MNMPEIFTRPARAFFSLPFFLLALTLCVSPPALARETRITPEDGMAGLRAALKKARPGDVIRLAPGVYPGGLKVGEINGTAEAPIIVAGEKGAILGGDPKRWEGSILQIEKSSRVVLKDLEIVGGERGVTLGGCAYVSIEGCHIHDMSNYGVMSYRSSHIAIKGNIIERSSKEHGVYLSGQGEEVVISDNVIRQTHINGVHINGKLSDVRVLRNVFDRTGVYPTPEGGASVTFVGGARDGLIANNLFLDTYGQCVTDGGTGLVLRNNVFEGYSWSLLLALKPARDIRFTGNVILPGKAVPLQISENALGSFHSDYNRFVTEGDPAFSNKDRGELSFEDWRKLDQDAHSAAGPAPFAKDASKKGLPGKYRLDPAGPAVDAGPEDETDAAIPPGLGAPRADQGLFGGPDNAWTR